MACKVKHILPVFLFLTAACNSDDQVDLTPTPISDEPTLRWEKSLTDNDVQDKPIIEHTLDGGYIMAAMSYPPVETESWNQNPDIWLVKMDQQGAIAWERSMGSSKSDIPFFLLQVTDGGYLLGAINEIADGDVSGNNGGFDWWIVRLDGLGTTIWEINLGGSSDEVPVSAFQEGNDFLIIGSSNSNDGDIKNKGSESMDLWVVRLDDSGAIIWQDSYGDESLDEFPSEIQGTEDGYLLAGSEFGDLWFKKFDRDFNLIWDKQYGGSQNEWISGITLSDNGVLVTATTASSDGDMTENFGSVDIWVAELDHNGELLWERSYGGSEPDMAVGVVPASDGAYWVTGHTSSLDGHLGYLSHIKGGADYWVLKIDDKGNILSNKTFGTSLGEKATSTATAGSNGVVIAGNVQGFIEQNFTTYIWLAMIE